MSEEKHVFTVESIWTGDSDGEGTLSCEGRYTDYARPAQLGGPEGKSNPEELLVNAVVSCYSITLAILAERKRLPLERFEVTAEGDVVRQPDKSLKFTAIRLKPRLHLTDASEEIGAKALEAAVKAEDYCLISKALHGNVEITVEPVLAS
ncbi:MAG: hypothetical protein GYA63_06845 [Armatimonadetes bacterium]|jgi:peroxiredoxin-like protein|nr:hypothetical protein [Armatimonadota bacterium]